MFVYPVPPLRAACPLLCLQERQAFLGWERGILMRSSPNSPWRSSTTSPCWLPILGGDAYAFLCQLDSVIRPSCWQVDCRESMLQRLRPPVPTASRSRGVTWALRPFDLVNIRCA